ncbi:MAG: methyltransferase domain-containing protein [Acidobacteriota bacterium]
MTGPFPDVLHLGCGRSKYPLAPAFGVDAVAGPAVDLVWDLDEHPWPLPDGVFGKVYLVNVLEHLADVVGTMEEIHRVCRPGAEVVILAPAASSHHLWTDVTHRRAFLSRSFQYFDSRFADERFSYTGARFEVLETTYERYEDWIWVFRPKWWERLLLGWVNRHLDLYERRFLYWYQTRNLYVRLRAVKGA